MLVWLTLPFYDFCGFRSVAVNSVYKLQFFTFISEYKRYTEAYPLRDSNEISAFVGSIMVGQLIGSNLVFVLGVSDLWSVGI